MRINDILQAQWIDMVFDGRNKKYGSYSLRLEYEKYLMRALLIGGLSFCFGMFLLEVYPKPVVENKVLDVAGGGCILRICRPKEIKNNNTPIKGIKKVCPKTARRFSFMPPVVVQDFVCVAKQKKKTVVVDTVPLEKVKRVYIDDRGISVNDKISVKSEIKNQDGVYDFVEQDPTFNGSGKDSAVAWIKERIVYPEVAREKGLTGKVFITFIVDKNGKVIDVKMAKDTVGGGCAEEAMRVVQSMPNWKPGGQTGNPVKVKVTLPVYFGPKK